MAETAKRVRLTPEEKLAKLKGSNRKGLEEISLEISLAFPGLDLSAKDAREILDKFLENIVATLHTDGRSVMLPGFGSFHAKERKARRVRNPREANVFKDVPASTAFRFKAGSEMKPVFHS